MLSIFRHFFRNQVETVCNLGLGLTSERLSKAWHKRGTSTEELVVTHQVVDDVVLVVYGVLRIQLPMLLSLHVFEKLCLVRINTVTVQALTPKQIRERYQLILELIYSLPILFSN